MKGTVLFSCKELVTQHNVRRDHTRTVIIHISLETLGSLTAPAVSQALQNSPLLHKVVSRKLRQTLNVWQGIYLLRELQDKSR